VHYCRRNVPITQLAALRTGTRRLTRKQQALRRIQAQRQRPPSKALEIFGPPQPAPSTKAALRKQQLKTAIQQLKCAILKPFPRRIEPLLGGIEFHPGMAYHRAVSWKT
jgi:hypothetical protein